MILPFQKRFHAYYHSDDVQTNYGGDLKREQFIQAHVREKDHESPRTKESQKHFEWEVIKAFTPSDPMADGPRSSPPKKMIIICITSSSWSLPAVAWPTTSTKSRRKPLGSSWSPQNSAGPTPKNGRYLSSSDRPIRRTKNYIFFLRTYVEALYVAQLLRSVLYIKYFLIFELIFNNMVQ